MQRYIDAEELMKEIIKCKFEITGCGIMYHAGNVQSAIRFAPPADVVPKSDFEKQKLEIWRLQGEVERLTVELEAMRGSANSYKMHYKNAKADVAKEIFTEIEFDIHNLDFDREETRAIAIEGIIANAKKKYTEEGNEV